MKKNRQMTEQNKRAAFRFLYTSPMSRYDNSINKLKKAYGKFKNKISEIPLEYNEA
jgi:hypothetical protein